MKANQDFGSPFYHLHVSLSLKKESFEVTSSTGDDNDFIYIMSLAEIVRFSRDHIAGYHLVTDLGHLLREDEVKDNKRYEGIDAKVYPVFGATLTLNEDRAAMHRLMSGFSEKVELPEGYKKATLFYQEDVLQRLYTKKGRLLVAMDKNPVKAGAKVAGHA